MDENNDWHIRLCPWDCLNYLTFKSSKVLTEKSNSVVKRFLRPPYKNYNKNIDVVQ